MASSKAMLKKVNVSAKRHIHGTNYPVIHGLQLGLILTLPDIKKCLDSGAEVYEVLPDRTTIRLTEENYNKNNRKKKEEPAVKKEEKEEDTVVSTRSSFIGKKDKNYYKKNVNEPNHMEDSKETASEEESLDEESDG